ncbi:HNH endonuclease [Sinorhizobium fredii]|uniref:HNH endonuclease n=1 Tax=Rhizobium fredii TaxID=380 RepID=UPI0004BBB849|nr:HNH endonuclease [Sinorhizobium fredii]ASY70312.1 hypothetical protein SF83666_c29050 [Sinorhizobium fredii CCBAU 83666]
MSDFYQPAIIRELLIHDGRRTKSELAATLAGYDVSVQEYYEKIVMRWPRITLSKHDVVNYDRSEFRLLLYPVDQAIREEAVRICEAQISEWLFRKREQEKAPEAGASIRYEVLRDAGGKCQLCGISSELRPIDIDHIIPRSHAKQGRVFKDGRWIGVNDRENLQALCFSCNRGKRDGDNTDFRRRKKLVRDRIPDIIRAEGRKPVVEKLYGRDLHKALLDKLTEELIEVFAADNKSDEQVAELADMLEVIFALAKGLGVEREELLSTAEKKRIQKGGFDEALFYSGDQV